jgi:hypothetical protein
MHECAKNVALVVEHYLSAAKFPFPYYARDILDIWHVFDIITLRASRVVFISCANSYS